MVNLQIMVSTRFLLRWLDYFTMVSHLVKRDEISIYPFFSQDGGVDSERTYIKQLVQKYQKDENGEPLFNDVDENSNDDNEDNIPQF